MTTAVQRTGRTLIKPILFDKLTTRITLDHPELDQQTAERIVEQALAYLATAATATQPIGPAPLVDIGWHTFLLHTRDYAAFCDRIAGRFIHHEPDTGNGPGVPLANAVTAIRANGYTIDPELWGISQTADCTATCAVPVTAADCTQCHAGCTDSPSH